MKYLPIKIQYYIYKFTNNKELIDLIFLLTLLVTFSILR